MEFFILLAVITLILVIWVCVKPEQPDHDTGDASAKESAKGKESDQQAR